MNKKIKVVVLIDMLQSLLGGAERQILELCQHIDHNRFELIVGCLFKKNHLLKEIEKLGIRTVAYRLERIYNWHGLRQGWAFRALLKKERPDILMTYHFGSDVWGTVFARLAGVPVIISNRRDAGFWRQKHHVLLYRWLNRWVNKIVAVSRAVENVVIKEEGVPQSKIQVIYNGIDLSRFSGPQDPREKKKEFGLAAEDVLIGCVGNQRPVKGHNFLIEAMAGIVRIFPQARLLFIGGKDIRDKDTQGELHRQVETLGLSQNVLFLGRRLDIPELLGIMDICVLPSLSEGLSNTLLEYMAAAKPVVATRTGGNPELISDGRNGLLVEPGDAQGLAAKIMDLLRDRDLAAHLGRQARQDVQERFSIQSMIAQYDRLFSGFTQNHAGEPS